MDVENSDGPAAPGDGPTADPLDADLSRIRDRAETVRDEAVERACSQLRARGDLSPDDREVVEQLADRLVERLLTMPAREAAAADGDEAVAETVRDLFET